MAIAVSMPKSGPTVERAVMGSWEKNVGDKVAKGDILFTYETDKTSYECKSQADGVLLEIFYEEGDEVAVFTNVCVIGNEGEDITEFRPESKGEISAPEEETDAENENAAFEELSTYAKEVRISPRAKKLAKEKGIDASIAKASGPCGRIIEKDIINLAKSAADTYRVSTVEYEDVKLSGIRRTISKTMHSSLATMAQLTHKMSFDASRILAYRKKLKEEGKGITLGDIVLYSVSRLLLKYPELNAHLLENDTIRYFRHVNLGVAVDTPRGLMVPTIFEADTKSLAEISGEVKLLAEECRSGKIDPSKLSGGTFTVSNLGSLGVESFTPIINPPQTALLGVCTISDRVRKDGDGTLSCYPAMSVSLTYDHRAIDGSPASRFERELCDTLENFTSFVSENEKRSFKKAKDGAYDVLVVGGGPGGYLCAERAAQSGLKVALFEEKALGGTCLNEGCIPTKTLLNSAKMYRHATESEVFGVKAQKVSFDHKAVIERKNDVVKALVSGVGATMRANKVTVINALAKIKGTGEKGYIVEADGKDYAGTRLVIATGSETFIPKISGLEDGLASGFVVTNKGILDMTKLPKSLVVIGGGVIGLEMAYYFASVGTKVTVIEMADKIAGNTDGDICKVLTEAFEKRGIEFKLSSKVVNISDKGLVYEKDGEKYNLACDKILLCAGRKARSENIGLEKLGLSMDRSAIVTDENLCTNVEDVYAIGDVNGKSMLAHTAYREAEVAVNHMLCKEDKMRYDVIPSVIYTDPEVACVGLSKEEAKMRGIKAKEIKLPLNYAGRYVAENAITNGFIKLVVDEDKNTLVGCHMVGSYASEIIITATTMIDTELSVERLKKLVFPHPTVSEIIREGIFKV